MAQFTAYPQDTMLAYFMRNMCGLSYFLHSAGGVVKDVAGQMGPAQVQEMSTAVDTIKPVDPQQAIASLTEQCQELTKEIQDYNAKILKHKRAAEAAMKAGSKETAVNFLRDIPKHEQAIKERTIAKQKLVRSIEAIKSNQHAAKTTEYLKLTSQTLETQHKQLSPQVVNQVQTEHKLRMEQADETRYYLTETGVGASSTAPELTDDEYIKKYLSTPETNTTPAIEPLKTPAAAAPAKSAVTVNNKLLQLAGGKGSVGT